ncbi:acetyltransferase [Caloramator sp. CAR-1]|uniref:acetyltransferase n=1 Tax=Caloramator sp. CAR-1 TaxID=3062777 RepID=UPI0026E289F1|nr:acetyltransferase [Caloramator sp. CAR-1]MDO6355567.1 acetyltransferase [Caloramator sp. CAR-1]
MIDVIIVGAGGHARVILDILLAMKNIENINILGFIDDNKEGEILGYKILGKMDDIKGLKEIYPNLKAVPAIGDNKIRKNIVQKLDFFGVELFTAVHPSVIIGGNVEIGEGTVVMPMAVINNSAKIGRAAIINSSAVIEHDNVIGDFAHISPGAHLAGTVKVGDLTHVGTGANVIPGVKIGKNVTIGAGATVIRDIDDNAVAVGVPAKVIKFKEDLE